jgi:urea transport system ATP-binding protein
MLTMTDVEVGYGRTSVIHGVTIEVPADEVVAVMGHNGAGKTTLLRAAVGLLPTRSGRITLDGEDVTGTQPHQRVRRGLAYVPQGQQSFGQLTTLENLQVVADTKQGGKALIDEALDLFPALKDLLGRRAGLLSGGQRQQLAIARALITAPTLLLLDEPTEGIQPSIIKEMARTLKRIRDERGLSIVVSEQVLSFALDIADRVLVIENGEIVRDDPREAVDAAQVSKYLSV